MNLTGIEEIGHVSEPDLLFSHGGRCIDQKTGLSLFGPLGSSLDENGSSHSITLGLVGSKKTVELSQRLITELNFIIPAPLSKQFMPDFPGFSAKSPLSSRIQIPDESIELVTRGELSELKKKKEFKDKVEYALEVIFNKMRNISEREPRADVILIAIPAEIDKHCTQYWDRFGHPLTRRKRKSRRTEKRGLLYEYDSLWEAEVEESADIHFSSIYRAIKTEAMILDIPTQVIKADTLKKKNTEDPCTVAWNLFVALYYKSGGYLWRLADAAPGTCFVGISFYESKDDYDLRTSMAQIFSHRGEGLVLKGEKAEKTGSDRRPHLDTAGMKKLIKTVLNTYKRQEHINPTRVVLHKSSQFSPEEIEGVEKALSKIHQWDILALDYSYLRLLRAGEHPPLRGTFAVTRDNRFHLYTRGYVPFQQKYWGPATPKPLTIMQHEGDTPIRNLCKELLALTKMNWNSSSYSTREPITLHFARKVGGLLSEAETKVTPKERFLFYM
jgi:hypothetical protein